jgi:hypothetical protein
MKNILLTLTLAFLATVPMHAAAISVDTWYGFSWSGTGAGATVNGFATSSTTTPITNPGDPAWTIDSATTLYLVIVDGFLSEDQFEAFNNLISLGLTSAPTPGSTECVGGKRSTHLSCGHQLQQRSVPPGAGQPFDHDWDRAGLTANGRGVFCSIEHGSEQRAGTCHVRDDGRRPVGSCVCAAAPQGIVV